MKIISGRLPHIICLLAISVALNAQNLHGKIVYSHHTASAISKPDSIFSISSSGVKSFITLGFDPLISHSGKYMAFENGPFPNSAFGANIWVRNLLTNTDLQIVFNNDYLNYFDFSPSEKELVYAQACGIFSTNIDGTNSYHTIINSDCYNDQPQVRFSDSAILFHNIHFGIDTAKFDGSKQHLITNTVPGDLYPTCSADGIWIAYIKGDSNLYKIKPGGTNLLKLTSFSKTDTIAPNPLWSSDSKTILFIGRINHILALYKVNTDGSAAVQNIYQFDASGSVFDYFLGTIDSIAQSLLPVTLINFTGAFEGKYIRLNWQTSQELNSNYFDVERSIDGNNFIKIGMVKAASNSNVTSSYSFFDSNLDFITSLSTMVFYRLKSVDKDATYHYSSVINIPVNTGQSATIFPNPSYGSFRVITKQMNQNLCVQIYNTTGQKVFENNFSNTISALIQLPESKGIYFITIKSDAGIMKQKLIIQ